MLQGYGHKLRVGNKDTRVMTAEEWNYLMPNNKVIDNNLADTKRVWNINGQKSAKWARCHIKALYEQRADDPVWLRGCLIFPDDMPISEAKALFKTFVKFGRHSETDKNETTFELIRNSGAVFIPYSAWRQSGTSLLKQWGNHGNYATSSHSGNNMVHIKLTPLPAGSNFYATTDPNQGCASRLVQDY